jgi:hypothetical protein
LPQRTDDRERLPVAVIKDTVTDAVAPREIYRIYVAAGSAVIMGVARQSVLSFTCPTARALPLARVAIAAVRAFG